MLIKHDPFLTTKEQTKMTADTRTSFKNYFDRVFENAFDDAFAVFDRPMFPWSPERASLGMESKPSEDGSLVVSIDIPGIKQEDIAIELADGMIVVSGNRKTATSSHVISKSFSVPEGYSEDDIKAELQDGILTLTLSAKSLPAKEVKKIAITST